MKLVQWPLTGGLLHLVQRGGNGRGSSPPSPLLAVPNVTSTATVLLYNEMVRCSVVSVKRLTGRTAPHGR